MDVFIYKHVHFLSTKHKPLLVSASSRVCRHVPAGQKGVCCCGAHREFMRNRAFSQHRDSHRNLSAKLP